MKEAICPIIFLEKRSDNTVDADGKLTPDVVNQICTLLELNRPVSEICNITNVPRYKINDIKFGKNYKDISSGYNIVTEEANYLPDNVAHEICKLLAQKYSIDEISRITNTSKTIISAIKFGKSHTNISNLYRIPEAKEYTRKLTPEEGEEICKLLATKKYKDQEIADMYGVKFNAVRDIRLRYRFREISCKYDW